MYIRNIFDKKLVEMLYSRREDRPEVLEKEHSHKIKVISTMLQLIDQSKTYEDRCLEFFKHLSTQV